MTTKYAIHTITIRPMISSTTVQNENFVDGESDMLHFLGERSRDDERAFERMEDRPVDRVRISS